MRITTARADAIAEAVAQVRAMGQKWYGAAKARGSAFSDKGRLAEEIATALEQLKDIPNAESSKETKEEARDTAATRSQATE